MIIKSNIKTYEIIFSEAFSFIEELKELENKFIVIDKNVYEKYSSLFLCFDQKDMMIIEAIEDNKSIDTALQICERMTALPSKRNSTLISFGGGIIQDVTGFAANILYRGTKWVFVPTTLLAQSDSCIGSKTSLNYLKFKNLLGTFYPPDRIFIDNGFLDTLSETDYLSGLGEVVKFNVMSGRKNFNKIVSDIDFLTNRDYCLLKTYVINSLNYKKTFIEDDEFDLDVRNLLNFAHTFGHAIESVSHYAVPHGQAVSVGMMISNIVSNNRGLLSTDIKEQVERLCGKVINVALLPEYFSLEPFIGAMKNDKKRVGMKLAGILMDSDFCLHKMQDIEEDEIREALHEAKKFFCE